MRAIQLRIATAIVTLAACACAFAFPARHARQSADNAVATPTPAVLVTYFRIPTHSAGSKGLEAVMVRPNDSAPHPLALITHGTPREPHDRATMTPLHWIPQAREFA